MTEVTLLPAATLAERVPVPATPISTPLPDYAVIRVQGEEAHDFLQRILTADIPVAEAARTVPAGLCTPKGRVQFLFRVIPMQADGFALVLPQALLDGAIRRLKLYVLRSKVSVHAAPELAITAFMGADAPGLPERAAALEPGAVAPLDTPDGARIVQLPQAPAEPPRYWLLGTRAESVDAPEPVELALWWRSAVRAGEPEIGPDTQERFIAQMIDLDHQGGVSFSKGCFPGQEVIARTHYKGTVKQRLMAFTAHAATEGAVPDDLTPGAEIRTPSDGRLAGHVVVTVAVGDGSVEGLASVRTELVEQHDGRLSTHAATDASTEEA